VLLKGATLIKVENVSWKRISINDLNCYKINGKIILVIEEPTSNRYSNCLICIRNLCTISVLPAVVTKVVKNVLFHSYFSDSLHNYLKNCFTTTK
jgi:hypothetical protein